MKAFQIKHNLSFQNFFTFTNPKIEKNNKIEEIPTACLMLMNTPKACPAAGSCRSVCLMTSGNPVYLDGKMKCRLRRNNAFMNDYQMFLRYLVINCYRHYFKNKNASKVAFRLNGVSDYPFESISVQLTKEDTDYIQKAFNIYIEPIRYGSVIEAVQKGLNLDKNELNYHLTLSHGSKFDTFKKALELSLNYAAAFNLKKSQPLPKTFNYQGKELTVIDGDITDCRFLDINSDTHIVGLRFKIVENKDNAKKLEFCIDSYKG